MGIFGNKMPSVFRKSAFGYSRTEVDTYIESLKQKLEEEKENSERLQSRIDEQEGQLEKYKEQERYIAGALLNAQTQAVEIERKAQEKYDQTILRLNEESKMWENRIAQNKERLLALDSLIQDFLTNVKTEMTQALNPSVEAWQKSIEEGENNINAIAEGKISVESEKKTEEKEKEEEVSSMPPVDAPPPVIDGNVQRLYWKLKKMETSTDDTDDRPIKPIESLDEPVEEEDPVVAEEPKKEEEAEIYMPAKSEMDRLTELCKELGVL